MGSALTFLYFFLKQKGEPGSETKPKTKTKTIYIYDEKKGKVHLKPHIQVKIKFNNITK